MGRLLAVIAVLAATLGGLVDDPSAAHAAAIPDAITGITLTTTSDVYDGWNVSFDCTWAVPPGSQAGDTFTLQLPPELSWAGSTVFDLYAPDGTTPVAHAVVDAATQLVTFTLTDYMADHPNGASGGCHFLTTYHSSGPGEHNVSFDIGDTVINIVINEGTPCTTDCHGVTQAVKYGWMILNDPDHPRLGFAILAPPTTDPVTQVVFTDTPGDGYEFDCDSLYSDVGPTVDFNQRPSAPLDGHYVHGQPYETTQPIAVGPVVACDANTLIVDWSGVPVGDYSAVFIEADVTDTTLPQYSNIGVVSMNGHTAPVVTGVHNELPSGSGSGPAIHLEKWSTADGGPATTDGSDFPGDFDTVPGKALAADVPTAITFTITNTGDQSLTNIVVTDATHASPALTDISCDFSALGGPGTGTTWPTGPLPVGASFTCTATLPAMAAGGTHSDTATVTANGSASPFTPVTSSDDWHGHVPTPGIDIEKWSTADGYPAGDFDTAPGRTLVPGTPTAITFTITNNGTEPLRDVVVSDQLTGGVGAITGLTCDFTTVGGPATGTRWPGPLAVGATFTCSGTVPAMASGDTHSDLATVNGVGVLSGVAVGDSDTWNGTVPVVESFPPTTPPTAPTTPPTTPITTPPSYAVLPPTPSVPTNTPLPTTGAAVGQILLIGGLLVSGGGLLVAARRRRALARR